MTSLFYKESLQVIGIAQQDYSRVVDYTCYDYDQLLPKEFSKEMIGQHVAKYLHDEGQGWVNWFHHESSQFVIAKKKKLLGYDIEGAEEGKDRFIGYAALAKWAFKEGIYQEKAFLAEKERKHKIHAKGNAAAADPGVRAANAKKKKQDVDMALPEQLVSEFEGEEERIAGEAYAAKPTASKDTSPSDEERSSKSSEEESSFGGDSYDEDDGDEEEDCKDDETEQQAGEKVSNPKQVSTKTVKSGPSQENNGDVSDVSDLEDAISGTAQSSQQGQEEGERRSVYGAGNQAMVSEIKELRAEVDAKSQAEAELNAKSDELEAVQNEALRLRGKNETTKRENNLLRRELEFLESANSKIANVLNTFRAAVGDAAALEVDTISVSCVCV